MEPQLLKSKLQNAMEGVVKILEKKGSTTYEELESLVGIFSFAARVACLDWAFL